VSKEGIRLGGAVSARQVSAIDRLARAAVLARLRRLHTGRLTIVESGVEQVFGQCGEPASGDSFAATIQVKDPRFYRRVASGGSVGAAEAYMAGYWTSPEVPALVQLMLRNRDIVEGLEGGLAIASQAWRRVQHRMRRNTTLGSRRNIAAHYDLGNEFFELFLDRNLMYSCAVFARDDMTLEEASSAKLDRICTKLELTPEDHLLEIGTGWGGLAMHAAAKFGCRVTTTTISQKQYQLATRRVAEAGLSDRVTVLSRDYRDLSGQFDKLVSVEMVEAVGHKFLDTFFTVCGRLLKSNGVMLLQAITIADQYYERARRSVDFIKRYIFPGSFIPSVTALCSSIARASDLRVVNLEDLTTSYARTLAAWRDRFLANVDAVRAQGFSDEFIRMWEYYLSYCEGGFREHYLGDVQILLGRPGWRQAAAVPRWD